MNDTVALERTKMLFITYIYTDYIYAIHPVFIHSFLIIIIQVMGLLLLIIILLLLLLLLIFILLPLLRPTRGLPLAAPPPSLSLYLFTSSSSRRETR